MSYIGKIAGMFFAPILFGVFFTTAPAHATSFVQTTYATKASNAALPTSVTATFLAPATAGDMLIAVVGADGSATINTPAGGWPVAINQTGIPSQAIFYRIADGGETGLTATVHANPGAIALQLYEYSGSLELDQTGSSSGKSATPSSGSFVSSENNELLFAAFTTDVKSQFKDASWNDAEEGFTERNDFQTSGGEHNGTYGAGDSLANSTGTQGVTIIAAGKNGNWIGQIASFRTPSTPPPPTTLGR